MASSLKIEADLVSSPFAPIAAAAQLSTVRMALSHFKGQDISERCYWGAAARSERSADNITWQRFQKGTERRPVESCVRNSGPGRATWCQTWEACQAHEE